MPWNTKTIKRHNKSGTAKTAEIANAVLRKSGDEGKALRIANWMTKKKGKAHKTPKPLKKPKR